MTPRQRAAAAGELTYLGGATCKYGHNGPRYTSTGECLGCRKRPDSTGATPPPDPRIRELSAKLHEAQHDIRQTEARLKVQVRKFDAEVEPLKKRDISKTVEREHNALEALRRLAAGLELDIESSRPAPDPARLSALLAAAGALATSPPRAYALTPATDMDIQAKRWDNCRDPDQVFQRALDERTKLLRETARARLKVAYPDRPWTTEEGAAVLEQVRADLNLPPLPVVGLDRPTKEDADERRERLGHEALRARLLSTGG